MKNYQIISINLIEQQLTVKVGQISSQLLLSSVTMKSAIKGLDIQESPTKKSISSFRELLHFVATRPAHAAAGYEWIYAELETFGQ